MLVVAASVGQQAAAATATAVQAFRYQSWFALDGFSRRSRSTMERSLSPTSRRPHEEEESRTGRCKQEAAVSELSTVIKARREKCSGAYCMMRRGACWPQAHLFAGRICLQTIIIPLLVLMLVAPIPTLQRMANEEKPEELARVGQQIIGQQHHHHHHHHRHHHHQQSRSGGTVELRASSSFGKEHKQQPGGSKDRAKTNPRRKRDALNNNQLGRASLGLGERVSNGSIISDTLALDSKLVVGSGLSVGGWQQRLRRQQQQCGSGGVETEPLSEEDSHLALQLSRFYRVDLAPMPVQQLQPHQAAAGNHLNEDQQKQQQRRRQLPASPSMADANANHSPLLELPRPTNVTVLIISWYPPILKLSWNLDELDQENASKLDFYEGVANTSGARSSLPTQGNSSGSFDLELAIGQNDTAGNGGIREANDSREANVEDEDEARLLGQLRERRLLVRKSLTCFQVTYNIINSPFKVIEEYPPYLRSVMLERLLPATEYSLQVNAVYLQGKLRQFSERVHFVSPTDNESRRFKENTYRPIHRYPDQEEQRELRVGLAQVRSEELTIVGIAVAFWLATIWLFFNKWGKIRMLEPYQPAYRETSGTFVASPHHHPSAHNLMGALATSSGSIGTGASGAIAKMSSFCGNLSSGPETGEQCAAEAAVTAQQQSSVVALAAPTTVGGSIQLPKATLEPELGSRKSSNMLLLQANRRFESLADTESMRHRRTDAELNFLFQSKAQALAKATAMWTRQQQQQQQFARLSKRPTSFASGPNQAGASQQVAARLRQLGASAVLQLAKGSPATTKSPVKHQQATSGPRRTQPARLGLQLDRGSSVGGARERLLRYYRQSQALDGYGNSSNLLARISGRSLDRQSETTGTSGAGIRAQRSADQPSVHQPSAALTELQAVAGGHEKAAAATNKLRRLLFMSKSNQHQHIATSTSSSTLVCVGAGSGYSGQPKSTNSVSLDHEASNLPPSSSRPNEHQHSSSSASLPSGCPGAKVVPLQLRLHKGTVSQEEEDGSEAPVQHHHILIEPPSPPGGRGFPSRQRGEQQGPQTSLLGKRQSWEADPNAQSLQGEQDNDYNGYDNDQDNQVDSMVAPVRRHEDAFTRLANFRNQQRCQGSSCEVRACSLCSQQSSRDTQIQRPFARQLAATSPTFDSSAGESSELQLYLSGAHQEQAGCERQLETRPRVSSVFVASPYSRAHRDSFVMLRALSQKKCKSAEDVAHLSSLVLQIWIRDRNPLLQSVSQQHLPSNSSMAPTGSHWRRESSALQDRRQRVSQQHQRPKSSLTVAHT